MKIKDIRHYSLAQTLGYNSSDLKKPTLFSSTTILFVDRFIQVITLPFNLLSTNICYPSYLKTIKLGCSLMQSTGLKNFRNPTSIWPLEQPLINEIATTNRPSIISALFMRMFNILDRGAFSEGEEITNSTIEGLEELKEKKYVISMIGSTGFLTGKLRIFRDNMMFGEKNTDNKIRQAPIQWSSQFAKNLTYTSLTLCMMATRGIDTVGMGLASVYLAGALVSNGLIDNASWIRHVLTGSTIYYEGQKTYLQGPGCEFAKSLVYTGGFSVSELILNDSKQILQGSFGMISGIFTDFSSVAAWSSKGLFSSSSPNTEDLVNKRSSERSRSDSCSSTASTGIARSERSRSDSCSSTASTCIARSERSRSDSCSSSNGTDEHDEWHLQWTFNIFTNPTQGFASEYDEWHLLGY